MTPDPSDRTPTSPVQTSFSELARQLAEADSTVELIERTLVLLRELVPCDSVIFDEVALSDGRTRGASHPPELVEQLADVMPLFERWFHQSPNIAYFDANPNGGARRWSDGDIDGFRRTELYREFMSPLGVHFQLSFLVPGRANAQRAFVLNRSEHDFTDAEVSICDGLAPYLSLLFGAGTRRTVHIVDGLDQAAGWNAFVVDQTGEPADAGAALDPAVRRWVRHSLEQRDIRLVVDAIDDEVDLSDGSLARVRLIPDPTGSHVLLCRTDSAPSDLIETSQDRIDLLTERQSEVLALVATGETNQQIARRLDISVETVKKHLTSSYRALDVSNRTAAVAVFRSTPSPESPA